MTPKATQWPFPPRLLDYPSLPPGAKPLPVPQPRPPQDTPPALF